MNEQERAEFEKWWLTQDTADLLSCEKRAAMRGWQAARAAGAEREAAIMKALGITYDAELGAEGSGYEVPAEPEPQYFATLVEAVKFNQQLIATECDKLAEREAAWQALVARVRQSVFYLPACHERDKVFDVLRSGPQPIPEGEVKK